MRRNLSILFMIAIAIMLADTFVFGIAHVDTASYTDQIIALRHDTFLSNDQWAEYRAFKPLYASASLILPLSPLHALLLLNGFFLFGLGFATYFFLLELGFVEDLALIGSVWTLLSYPVVAYGFAYGTDISGWFFAVATMLLVLIAIRKDSPRLFVFASLIGFLGAASKETGVLGLFFGGVYLLLLGSRRGWKKTILDCLWLSLPFLALEGILLGAIYTSGLPGFFGWVTHNNQIVAGVHSLKFFLGGELATFNLFLLFAAFGLYALVRHRVSIEREKALALLALFIAALPVIEWPIFIDRVLFSQFSAVIPFALYGALLLEQKIQNKKALYSVLYLLPLLVSIVFVILGGHDGLYLLLHRLAHA